MFSEAADEIVAGHNFSLFSSSIRSLVGEQETSSLIVIPVKEYTLGTITVSQGTTLLTGFFTVIAVPVLLTAAGILIWMRRRKA